MTTISSHKDVEHLTLTFTAEFAADAERLWQVWADPDQLGRWWGPPGYPATFEQHDFTVGGRSAYFMTGPGGEKHRGWWEIDALDRPRRLEFRDGFADADGKPVTEPFDQARFVVTLEPTGSGTRMTTVAAFSDADQLAKAVEAGMDQGIVEAMGQLDDVLAA